MMKTTIGLFGRNKIWVLTTLILAGITPLISGYALFQAGQLLTMILAVHALNVLSGYNGQISLGNGAFFAVGAYTCVILVETGGIPYPIAVVLATFTSFATGALVGYPALRLGGIYLALATFSLAVAIPQLLQFGPFEFLTGGVNGLALTPPEVPFGLNLSQDQWLYLFTLAVVSLSLWLGDNLTRRTSGRTISAIQDDPLAADALGIDVARSKIFVFAISAAMTGTAGALGALLIQFVAPESFQLFFSITLLVAIVVGGLRSLGGSIAGALFIYFVPELVDQVSKTLTGAVFGLFLVGCMIAMPGGIAGFVEKILHYLRTKIPTRPGSNQNDNVGISTKPKHTKEIQ